MVNNRLTILWGNFLLKTINKYIVCAKIGQVDWKAEVLADYKSIPEHIRQLIFFTTNVENNLKNLCGN